MALNLEWMNIETWNFAGKHKKIGTCGGVSGTFNVSPDSYVRSWTRKDLRIWKQNIKHSLFNKNTYFYFYIKNTLFLIWIILRWNTTFVRSHCVKIVCIAKTKSSFKEERMPLTNIFNEENKRSITKKVGSRSTVKFTRSLLRSCSAKISLLRCSRSLLPLRSKALVS